MNIGDETRRAGADDDAGDEVADQGGNLDAFSQEAKHEGDAEAGGDGGDEGEVVVHASSAGCCASGQ
ncbi:hypothetical protein D3C81_1427240 [compost metagenome]